jgi:hypothetical protein
VLYAWSVDRLWTYATLITSVPRGRKSPLLVHRTDESLAVWIILRGAGQPRGHRHGRAA